METRKIPSPNNSLTFFMEKMNGEIAEYETSMVNLEKQIEKRLIDTFRSFDINAALFLVDARPLMCHEAVLTRLRPIATLIPALHD